MSRSAPTATYFPASMSKSTRHLIADTRTLVRKPQRRYEHSEPVEERLPVVAAEENLNNTVSLEESVVLSTGDF